ncbi:hypothetical protein [Streptomyces africanus]|uniref:hypothetical protein n=1 Tax=Streptomyces africanus TaxID=231024 RepID=UPI000A378D55|nr:hypothetical protein [Streptomyces africanus]
MTTLAETLATGAKHDPGIIPPNTFYDLLRTVEALCPCGNTTSVRDGVLTTHEPKSTWDRDGKRRPVIADATGTGWTCRYSGRTVTLAAALERDAVLTPAEKYTRDTTLRRLKAGIVDRAPAGYALPKPVAELFALAEANGWTTAQAWASRDDGYALDVRVSRATDEGWLWKYDLSYFVAPGVARRTPFGLSVTPDRRRLHDTPSIKAIRAVITANPVEG